MGVGAAVVDAHHHRPAGLLVHDPDLGAEGQGPVGGGHVVGVEGFAARGPAALEAGSVPGSAAALDDFPRGCAGSAEAAGEKKAADPEMNRLARASVTLR